MLDAGNDGAFEMNDWSFGQLCRLAGVAKDTVNRLSPDTASRVFGETLPQGPKPLQLFTLSGQLRSIHPASYTRLFNADLLAVIQEFAVGSSPRRKASTGRPACTEASRTCSASSSTRPAGPRSAAKPSPPACSSGIPRSAAAASASRPSGSRRSVRTTSCGTRQRSSSFRGNTPRTSTTPSAKSAKPSSRLVQKRDQRRDAFVKAVQQAMVTTLGSDAEEVQKAMSQNGIPRALINEAIEIAQEKGRFTIFAMVDALTRIAGKFVNAGERIQVDQKAAGLLALAV